MCGIVGVAGTLTLDDKKAFDSLLIVDSIRGKDGTGVAAVKKGHPDQTYLVKASGGPEALQDRMSYHQAVNQDRMFILGHNRFRTEGDVSARNSHPFEFSNIIGAHNGNVDKKLLHNGTMFAVSSEALFYHMNEFGVADTVSKLAGAYSLVWWDKSRHSLNMLRNAERPLYFVTDDAGSAIFWASEIAMLFLALNHNRIKFSGKKVYSLAEDTHVEWIIPLKHNVALPAPLRTKMKGYTRPFVSKPSPTGHGCGVPGVNLTNQQRHFPIVHSTTASPGNSNTSMMKPGDKVTWDEHAKDFHVKGQLTVVPKTTPGIELSELKLNRLLVNDKGVPFYMGANANIVHEAEFNVLTDKGCSNCGQDVVFSEPVKFLREGGFICVDCMTKDAENIQIAKML